MSEKKKNTKEKNKIIELKFGVEDPMDLEMDALLQEELMREADELEAKLNSDPDLIGMGASEDLFAKIVGELKEKGLWEEEAEGTFENASGNTSEGIFGGSSENSSEGVFGDSLEDSSKGIFGDTSGDIEDSRDMELDLEKLYAMLPEEDRRAMEMGRRVEQEQEALKQKKIARRKRRNRIVRRGGTVAAALVLVFGVSMTSDANRRLVSQMWDSVTANFGLKMATEYVDEERVIRKGGNEQEEKDYQKVSEELGVSGVDLGYLPEGMEYLRCELDAEQGLATMFYSYQDAIFRFCIVKNSIESVYYYALDNKAELTSVYTESQKIEAKIGEANTENHMETYVAQLQYEDSSYILNGMISLEEMEKIVKNIYFL